MSSEKIIDRIAKLKAHAESAKKIGNEEEAQAFAEMFQKLMLRHKISMTEVEYANLEKDEPVDRYDVDLAGNHIKEKKARVQWSERLAGIVARAHFCRIMIHYQSNRITLVGRRSDAEIAEYMFVTLHRLVEKIADKEYVAYFHECKRNGDVTLARGFRASFIQAFILRLSQRYDEQRATATGESSTALVRVEKAEQAAEQFLEDHGKKARALSNRIRRRARASSVGNVAGIQRGVNLANKVELGAKAVKTGQKPKGQLG